MNYKSAIGPQRSYGGIARAEKFMRWRDAYRARYGEAAGFREIPSQVEGPCPNCGGDNRFHIKEKEDVFYCRVCDPSRANPDACQAIAKELDTMAGIRNPRSHYQPWERGEPPYLTKVHARSVRRSRAAKTESGKTISSDLKSRYEEQKRVRRAANLWAQAVPVTGTPAEAYLRSRGLYWPERPRGYEACGWIPHNSRSQITVGYLFRDKPAEVAGVIAYPHTWLNRRLQTAAREVRKIAVEYLDVEGQPIRKESGKKLKRGPGVQDGACFLVRGEGKRDTGSRRIHVCEGECTALAIHTYTDETVIATGGTSGMKKLRAKHLATEFSVVVIHPDIDRNRAGMKAAKVLRGRLKAAGLTVRKGEWTEGVDAADITGTVAFREGMRAKLDAGKTYSAALETVWPKAIKEAVPEIVKAVERGKRNHRSRMAAVDWDALRVWFAALDSTEDARHFLWGTCPRCGSLPEQDLNGGLIGGLIVYILTDGLYCQSCKAPEAVLVAACQQAAS